jgi:hypothetical protein
MTDSSIVNTTGNDRSRLVFFDKLRYLFVFAVVLQHAGNAYHSSVWPVSDIGGSGALTSYINALLDSFLMPALFFISGYFALSSIRKQDITSFIKGKFRRLGIPWLVIILCICPVLPLIYHYTRDGMKLTFSYWQTWRDLMLNTISLDFGFLPSRDVVMDNDLFYQRYMWFLGLLLLFFVIFALIYKWKRSWFDKEVAPIELKNASVWSTLKLLLVVGFITSVGSFSLIIIGMTLGGMTDPDGTWFTLGNLVQFRVSRIFMHTAYFSLGVLACKGKWIERGKFPGHLKTWLVSVTILLFGIMSAKYMSAQDPELFGVLYFFIMNFLCFASLGLFSSIGIKYWNKPSVLSQNLAANSFNMYMSHYPFVLFFQFILLFIPGIPQIVKYGIVSILSLGFGWLVCQYLIRPFPRATVALLFGTLMFMLVLIRT